MFTVQKKAPLSEATCHLRASSELPPHIEHILCTRTASRTNFGVKNQFLEAVVAAIDRESIARVRRTHAVTPEPVGAVGGTFWAA